MAPPSAIIQSDPTTTIGEKQCFLTIPRELRDKIYGYYFQLEDGYTYDFDTKKLIPTNGDQNTFVLRSVSHQIEEETRVVQTVYVPTTEPKAMMEGRLVLERNTIRFRTYWSPNTNDTYGIFARLISAVIDLKTIILFSLLLLPSLSDSDTRIYIEDNHPQFLPFLDIHRADPSSD